VESYPPITLFLVRLAASDVFIINNDQNITFIGHTSPLNNFLGTQASQHCNNTLFKMGVQNLGCYTEVTQTATCITYVT
jgi:hypothetical protein